MEKSFDPDFQIKTCLNLLLRFVQKLQLGRSRLQESKGGWFRKLVLNSFQENERIFVELVYFFKSVNMDWFFLALAWKSR